MALRVLGPWCRVVGHNRDAATRRNLNGAMFATCKRCGADLFREPIRGVWRATTAQDRQPRGFAIVSPGDAGDAAHDGG